MNRKVLKSITDNNGALYLYAFFILLPLTYALQVISGRSEVAVLAYGFLILAYITLFWKNDPSWKFLSFPRSLVDFLPLGFCFLLIHHSISVGDSLLAGDLQMASRGMLLFTLPLLLFWAVQQLRATELRMILVLLAILGCLVCCELLYENFSIRILRTPTIFQLLNRDYTLARNGYELTQLSGIYYRPPGILEHLHAVTYFAAFAALANAILFCLNGRWYWFVGMCLCTTALLMHGVRLPVASAILMFTLLAFIFYKREKNPEIRKRGIYVFWTLLILVLIQLFVDPLGTSRDYYFPAFLRGDFQVQDATTSEWVINESTRLVNTSSWGDFVTGKQADIFVALFGHGIVGSLNGLDGISDDLFMLSLLAQYGLLGAVVFFGIWLVAIYCAVCGLLRTSDDKNGRAALYFATGVLVMMAVGMAHSSVLQRKAIFPYFPLAAGIAWRYARVNKEKLVHIPAGQN